MLNTLCASMPLRSGSIHHCVNEREMPPQANESRRSAATMPWAKSWRRTQHGRDWIPAEALQRNADEHLSSVIESLYSFLPISAAATSAAGNSRGNSSVASKDANALESCGSNGTLHVRSQLPCRNCQI